MSGIEQTVRQGQELHQYQLQRLEVLEMSGDELSEFLNQAENENPLINVERDRSEIEKELRLANWFHQQPVYSRGSYERTVTEDMPEPEIPDSRTMSLEQYLRLQIDFLKLTGAQQKMMNFLLGSIEDNGRLKITSDQAAACCKGTAKDSEYCLALLRRLEPAGICAASVQECLLVQLRKLPQQCETAEYFVKNCLQSAGTLSMSRLARKCGVKIPQMERALRVIRGLEPYPGACFAPAERAYVIPDILMLPKENGWDICLCDKWSGSIHISQYYINLLKGSHDKENATYLYDRLRQAKMLQTALEQRRKTLVHLCELILDRQRAFFENGGPIEPLLLGELAQELPCHESTVSRALRGKYLSCPRGTFPLRKFVSLNVGNSDVSNDGLTKKIKELIAAEDPGTPLSDQQITDLLAANGLNISRRTIAKYRTDLGIPNVFARRV